MGFEELPRNASQALKLSGLSIERLGEVWENVLKKCQGHKITADAIAQEIDPDAQPAKSSILLPVGIADKLHKEAVMRGISVAEYIQELMDLEQAEGEVVEPTASASDIDDEITDLLDRAEARPQRGRGAGVPQRQAGRLFRVHGARRRCRRP